MASGIVLALLMFDKRALLGTTSHISPDLESLRRPSPPLSLNDSTVMSDPLPLLIATCRGRSVAIPRPTLSEGLDVYVSIEYRENILSLSLQLKITLEEC